MILEMQDKKTNKTINAYLCGAVINSESIYLRFSLLNCAVSIQFMIFSFDKKPVAPF